MDAVRLEHVAERSRCIAVDPARLSLMVIDRLPGDSGQRGELGLCEPGHAAQVAKISGAVEGVKVDGAARLQRVSVLCHVDAKCKTHSAKKLACYGDTGVPVSNVIIVTLACSFSMGGANIRIRLSVPAITNEWTSRTVSAGRNR